MSFQAGQGVLGKITFVDGTEPMYDRTYLVVEATTDYIEVLNVSSIKGKQRKLAFPTNEKIRGNHWPPFKKPSFVKLDSLTRVPSSDFGKLSTLANGGTIDSQELERIKAKIK